MLHVPVHCWVHTLCPGRIRTLLLACSTILPLPAEEPAGVRGAFDRAKAQISDRMVGLQVTAFGDVLWARDGETGRGRLDWGAAELDLNLDLHPDLQAAAALVWTREATLLTVGFLDYHLFGGRIAPRGRLWAEKGFHLQAGRFDVPFGNDWQFFASKDSVSVTRPLTTDAVMEGGYNDAGVRALGNTGAFNFNLYALRGFSQGRLYGGRMGLAPFGNPYSLKGAREGKGAEFGFSALLDRDGAGRKRGSATAWDVEYRGGSFQVRAELLERRWEAGEDEPARTLRGWHATVEVPLEEWLGRPLTVFARIDRAAASPLEEGPGDARDARVSAGFSLDLGGVIQLKAEVQRWSEASASTRGAASYGGTQGFARLVWVF